MRIANILCESILSPCRKRSPAKGVWQKSDEKSDRSIRKSDRKVTESVPKTEKSDRTPFAALLLRHPDSRFEKTFSFFANRPSRQWDSSEDWTRITRISMQIGEKTRSARIWTSALKIGFFFLRIDSRESIHANLRNVGVRIACPLSSADSLETHSGFRDQRAQETLARGGRGCNTSLASIFMSAVGVDGPDPKDPSVLKILRRSNA